MVTGSLVEPIVFQSTLSVRRATPLIPFRARLNSNFNPRSP